MITLTQKDHKERHIELHKELDELIADYITVTGKRISNSTILELVQWSSQQTEHLTHKSNGIINK